MFLDIIGTSPSPSEMEVWDSDYGRSVRELFMYSPGGRRCRRVTRYRLAENWLAYPQETSDPRRGRNDPAQRESPEPPAFLTFWEFDDWADFTYWEKNREEGQWNRISSASRHLRCLWRAQYLRLSPVIERGPRGAPEGFNFINLAGTFVENPNDPAQLEAWQRVYSDFMTHSVFARHSMIKRMSRFMLAPGSVDGLSERGAEYIPPFLTTYEFDTWDDFLTYHDLLHNTPEGADVKAGRKAWAEGLAGVKAPPAGNFLYRVQYRAIETLARDGELGVWPVT